MDAAIAMQAANQQGKAWEMHDAMFEGQPNLTRADLERYAGKIGIDVGKFKKAMDDSKLKDQVLADQKIANATGASGTPTFFINGTKLVGAQPFDQFQTTIDAEIARAKQLLESGTSKAELYATASKP